MSKQGVNDIKASGRLIGVDIAKGVAIVLVVIGHWNPSGAPEGWAAFVRWIYTFHMPLFLFVSGYLFGRSEKPYRAHIESKVKRLLVPYFTTSVIIISIKLLSAGNLTVDHPVTPWAYLEMLWYPSAGYFLWFIWTLLWCFVLVPLFRHGSRLLSFTAVTIVMAYIQIELPEIFCLDQTRRMMMWFALGVCAYDFRRFVPIQTVAFATSSVCLFVILTVMFFIGIEETVILLPYVGTLSSLSLAWLCGEHLGVKKLRIILSLSAASYIIYLFHTTFEGLAKGLMQRLAADPAFGLVTSAVIISGVAIPWWLYSSVLKRYRLTRLLFGLG